MWWKCKKCGLTVCRVLCIFGHEAPKERFAYCDHCHKATWQYPVSYSGKVAV